MNTNFYDDLYDFYTEEMLAGEFSESTLLDRGREEVGDLADRAFTYTEDIIEVWRDAGMPEPICMGGTIIESLGSAVYEYVMTENDGNVYDALDDAAKNLFESHIAADEGVDTPDDRSELLDALADYADKNGGF